MTADCNSEKTFPLHRVKLSNFRAKACWNRRKNNYSEISIGQTSRDSELNLLLLFLLYHRYAGAEWMYRLYTIIPLTCSLCCFLAPSLNDSARFKGRMNQVLGFWVEQHLQCSAHAKFWSGKKKIPSWKILGGVEGGTCGVCVKYDLKSNLEVKRNMKIFFFFPSFVLLQIYLRFLTSFNKLLYRKCYILLNNSVAPALMKELLVLLGQMPLFPRVHLSFLCAFLSFFYRHILFLRFCFSHSHS